jgi:hypothetical protein
MIVPPSLVDTVSHRHDADLFGYVIEGTVEVGLDTTTVFLLRMDGESGR